MSFTAALLVSAVIPPVPMRQWVLSVPKRLRYFLARDGEFLNRTIALAIRHIEQHLRAHTPLADPTARLGAVVFIQRFGSLLNAHTHLHLIVLDGLCQNNPEGGVRFMPADPIDQVVLLIDVRGRLELTPRPFQSKAFPEKLGQRVVAAANSALHGASR